MKGKKTKKSKAIPASDSVTVGDFALSVLRAQFDQMLAHEAGTRSGEDPEELHDMRVAARRLRAAIRLFRPVLPPGWKAVRDELSWLAKELGQVRDLDVMVGKIEDWLPRLGKAADSTLTLLEMLRQRRESQRVALRQALDSDRYSALIEAFRANLAEVRTGEAEGAVEKKIPALIERRARRFLKAADRLHPDSTGPERHQVRILAKRLRYAVEFSIPIYSQRAETLAGTLAQLQDIFGAHQDAYVAKEFVAELAGGTESLAPALAATSARYDEEIRKDSRREREILGQKIPKEWERLRRRMRKRAKNP